MHEQERSALAALVEPRRRRVFDVVVRAGHPLTRDEVAGLTGTDRALAAHHLDRLAEAGLLLVTFARPAGRAGGPGAGRPAKHYAPATSEVAVSVPPRRYDLVARILARALVAGGAAAESVPAAAFDEGRRIATEWEPQQASGLEAVRALLADLGYEPRADGPDLRLANCPFHALLEVSVDLVCGANRAFCAGIVEGLDADPVRAVLDPRPGSECCVRLST